MCVKCKQLRAAVHQRGAQLLAASTAAACSRCRKHPNADPLANARLASPGGLPGASLHGQLVLVEQLCSRSSSLSATLFRAAANASAQLCTSCLPACLLHAAETWHCLRATWPVPVRPDSRLQTLFLLQLLHAMHVTLLQRQDECMDQSYNAHEENESRRLCSPAVSTAAWTTRLRLSPIKALRGDEERDRARAREGGREREYFIQEGNRAPVLETTHSRNWATRGFAC